MALYFFQCKVIHLEGQNHAEPQPRLLGERWSASHQTFFSAELHRMTALKIFGSMIQGYFLDTTIVNVCAYNGSDLFSFNARLNTVAGLH